jgi:uncharacterized protein
MIILKGLAELGFTRWLNFVRKGLMWEEVLPSRARLASDLWTFEAPRRRYERTSGGNRVEQEMSEQIGNWDELELALLDLDEGAMVLEELDGFIAGLLVCPELIPPGEWFARAMGLSKSQPSPFTGLDHANDVLGLVMDYYNDVATTLERHPERYRPRFPVDEHSGDVIWELWMEGFGAAADLRYQAWGQLIDVGGPPARAGVALALLTDIISGESYMDEEEAGRLRGNAQETIRTSILVLHAHRLATQKPVADFADQPNPFASSRKVGRNEPCLCGSGKKYKRCCGRN